MHNTGGVGDISPDPGEPKTTLVAEEERLLTTRPRIKSSIFKGKRVNSEY